MRRSLTRKRALSIVAIAQILLAVPAQAQNEPQRIELLRAQTEPLQYTLPPIDPAQVPPPKAVDMRVSIPVPDRWRIMESLGVKDQWWDPYNQNTIKGDKPYQGFSDWGSDWFLALGAVSDSLYESRRVPTSVGAQSAAGAGANNVFGRDSQDALVQTFIVSASLIKGNTTFKPQDYEFRFAGAFNVNQVQLEEVRGINVNPERGTVRKDSFFGVQEAFADVHLRNVSDHYDFDSMRLGIQPFNADFRGFLLNDAVFGARFFGNRDNNQWQYNLGWFKRFEKDTNSGLNDIRSLRSDDTLVASAYRQDWPVPGHTTQATILYNMNREGEQRDFYDANGAQIRPSVIGDVRPHNYDVAYFGLNGDGHFGRWNLSSSAYLASGNSSYDPIAQKPQTIEALFAAAELSRDFDWLRVRTSLLYASGDKNPFDGRSTGFDAILENPQFAGADTSYWIRQAIPLIGGGGVALSGRNGVLASLRSSKDQGQSNFVNPGLHLWGIGFDADLLPQLRLIGNINHLQFDDTAVLRYLRNQGHISNDIGTDFSLALQYRPYMTQNLVLNASIAWLEPGQGYKDLYAIGDRPYSFLFNLILTF
jgi:hypothetical protein